MSFLKLCAMCNLVTPLLIHVLSILLDAPFLNNFGRRSVIYFTMSNLIRPLSCPAPAAEVVALKVATHRQLAYYLRFSDQSKKKKEKRKKQISVQTAWNRSSAVQMTDRTDSLVRCEPSSSSRWWSCCSSRDSTFWCICSVLRHHPLS